MPVIQGVTVTYPEGMPEEEVSAYVKEEIDLWHRNRKEVGSIELELDGTNVIVRASEKSPIRRVRRITGYLSTVDRFNGAKQAELVERDCQELRI